MPSQDQPPPNAPEFGGSSPIGLVVIVLLFIAMGFLVRSMNKHLRKVPASFDEPDQAEQTGAEQTGAEQAEPGGVGSDTKAPGTTTTGEGSAGRT
ncbi:MAG TPA: hypothetical protein VIQ30_02985 [Pseudonocardia sp.]